MIAKLANEIWASKPGAASPRSCNFSGRGPITGAVSTGPCCTYFGAHGATTQEPRRFMVKLVADLFAHASPDGRLSHKKTDVRSAYRQLPINPVGSSKMGGLIREIT